MKLKNISERSFEILVLSSVLVLLNSGVAQASGIPDVSTKFNPILDVLRQLARPVAQGTLIYAGILFILGQKHKSWQFMRGTFVGYILIQWAPMFMDIIDSIGKGTN
jgi:hypothetical protein